MESFREAVKVALPAALLVALGFWAAYLFVEPAPPRNLRIAAGETDGAYFRFAERYQTVLERAGISVDVVETSGSIDNLGRLSAGDVDAAFVQGGSGDTPEGLFSLGSLYYEPVWLFHGSDLEIDDITDLAGRRVATGREGSGTRALAMMLLREAGVADAPTVLQPLGGAAAAEALRGGEVDALFAVGAPSSALVSGLLRDPGVHVASLRRAQAWARVHRFLTRLTLPEGAVDLAANVPPRPVTLLAATANLVVQRTLHPALSDLLLQAAHEIHGDGGLFEEPGSFPAPDHLVAPLAPEADRYYRQGPPFLQRYLPFWVATQADRLKVMLLPLVVLLLPLFRALPPAYRWRVRSRIYRWYRRLQDIDHELQQNPTPERMTELRREIEAIETAVAEIAVPLSYADQLYALRLHLDLVRRRGFERPAPSPAE